MILDPNLLSREQTTKIVNKFQSILNRSVLDLPIELQQEDRIELCSAFNIKLDHKIIYDNLYLILYRNLYCIENIW